MPAEEIRQTAAPLDRDRVRSVPLDHPGVGELASICMGTGIDERVPGARWGEKTQGSHLLFYVASGCVVLEAVSLKAGPGEMLCVPAAFDKFLATGADGVLGTWAHMKNEGIWQVLGDSGPRVTGTSHAYLLLETMRALLVECVSPAADAAEAVPQLSRLFRHFLMRQVDAPQSRDRQLMAHLAMLWDHVAGTLDRPWTVDQLSKRVNMSPSHFHREVMRLHRRSPMDVVKQVRMDHAAMLLKTTPVGLDVIAERVGYSTAYAFSHAFLNHMGIRPGAYRRASG